MVSPEGMPLRSRAQLNIKHVVSDIHTLMGFGEVVMRQPFMVDMIKMTQAESNEVVKTLFLDDADAGFGIPVWRCNQLHLMGNLKHKLFV